MDVPQSKLQNFREVFQQYDRDNDDYISMRELSQVMKAFQLNNEFTGPQVESITEQISNRVKGEKIDIEMFINIISEKYIEFGSGEEVINAFRTFDKDGNGSIPCEELRHVMTSLGDCLTDEEVDEMIREADINGEGVIYYEDFVRTMISK